MSLAKNKHIIKLMEMLRFQRPHFSYTEEDFIRQFLRDFNFFRDSFGNYHIQIGKSEVLWSCHTDTVHTQRYTQTPIIDNNSIRLKPETSSNCLGADCTTGVWLMLEMIEAKVPGLYVFHRGEELGGLGSNWILKNTPELLEGIQYAIAFDRYGFDSIITHQGGLRYASDAFAGTLSRELSRCGMKQKFIPDNTGTFTDTAIYTDIIPECTNISVGYFNQHTKDEYQDIPHALALRAALLKFDENNLAAFRDPADDACDVFDWTKDYYYSSDSYRKYDNEYAAALAQTEDEYAFCSTEELIRKNPQLVLDLLDYYGFSSQEVRREILALL